MHKYISISLPYCLLKSAIVIDIKNASMHHLCISLVVSDLKKPERKHERLRAYDIYKDSKIAKLFFFFFSTCVTNKVFLSSCFFIYFLMWNSRCIFSLTISS